MDIYPTACDLSGVEIPMTVQGKSLVPVLKDPSVEVKEAALSIVKEGHSLRSARWAYMGYKDGSEEFYDMDADPGQFTNLVGEPEHAAVLSEWRGKLKAMLEAVQ